MKSTHEMIFLWFLVFLDFDTLKFNYIYIYIYIEVIILLTVIS
jgi:hypothetical protein